MTTLDIELLGAMRELAAAQLPSDTSIHSGRPLRRFALELHVPDERHQELEAELQAAATAEGPHLRGSEGRWRVLDGWSKVSTGRRREICIYRMEVQEVQEVQEAEVPDLVDQPFLARTAERVMANSRALAELLEELHARGVLDEGRSLAIAAAATPRPLTREEARELCRTDRLSH
ncbi:hypothetical protein [Streptomyces phaeochromogenes]|uniref:hypothetical protein n=1 Tax=Streptomyces phaeochromogenes TaxID=1923 RepID=UPI0038678CD0|nr:hypothetical protein OHB08_00740 [Streptomyces phaeochromogenes]